MNNYPLGPPAHTTGQVYERYSVIATWKYEIAQFGQALVHAVYVGLQPLGVGGQQIGRLYAILARLGGQESPNCEQTVLHFGQDQLSIGSDIPETHQTYQCIEFIDSAVCLNANMVLRHPSTA